MEGRKIQSFKNNPDFERLMQEEEENIDEQA
jgi:hypothetical protein